MEHALSTAQRETDCLPGFWCFGCLPHLTPRDEMVVRGITMLTRLKVNGFKNLVNIDVRFGPFTCIAGPNAVGKSNLFDAIRFLSALSNQTLMDAALSVRSETVSDGDVRNIFHRVGDTMAEKMSFEVEMIAPAEAVDDLGQVGRPTANHLRYTLELRYREGASTWGHSHGPLEVVKEELVHIHVKDAPRSLLFDHSPGQWRNSALRIHRRGMPFISTRGKADSRVIHVHQDSGGGGRTVKDPASQPRTVLCVANASESPTALCARREMESWRMLQLEPSALREPDSVNAPPHLAANGLHLPATLYRLAKAHGAEGEEAGIVHPGVADRLAHLVTDVVGVEVDLNEVRELLTVVATGKDGTRHPARSLSDGTLRFLALVVMQMDPLNRGLICLEEPENSIHPGRIAAVVELLQDIPTDPARRISDQNSLSQVIVNTHSPAVVLQVPDDSLLIAESLADRSSKGSFRKAVFGHLPNTWRDKIDPPGRIVPKDRLLSYLNPGTPDEKALEGFYAQIGRRYLSGDDLPKRSRVADRDDLQPLLIRLGD
jgi:predicted ATPase